LYRVFSELRSILSGNVSVMALSWFLYGLSGALVHPFFTLYAKELGADDLSIATVRSIAMASLALSVILGGFLTDIIGRVKTILIGTTLITLVQYGYALATSWSQLAVLWVIDQAAHFYQPALTAIVMDSLPRDKVLRGFIALNIFPSIPWLFMPVIGGYIYDVFGLMGVRVGFAISGAVSTIVLALRVKLLRETLVKSQRRDGFTSLFRELAQHKPVVFTALRVYAYTAFLAPLATAVAQVYGAIYVVEVLRVKRSEWGFLNGLSTLASITASAFLATLHGLSELTVLVVGGSMLVSSQLLLALASYAGEYKLLVLSASSITGAVSGAIVGPLISTMLTRILPPVIRGRMTGFQRMLESGGSALTSLLAGYMYVLLGAVKSLVFSSFLGLLSVLYLAYLYRRVGRSA